MFKFNNLFFFVNFPYFLKKWVIKIKIVTQINRKSLFTYMSWPTTV